MKENDAKFIEKLNVMYVIAAFILLFGVSGIMLGIWVQFFRASSPGELMLNRSLLMYSVGIVFSAILNIQSFGIIKRLSLLTGGDAG